MRDNSFESRAVREWIDAVADILHCAADIDWMWDDEGNGVRIDIPYLGAIYLECDRERSRRHTSHLQQIGADYARSRGRAERRSDITVRIEGFRDGVSASRRRRGLGKRGEGW